MKGSQLHAQSPRRALLGSRRTGTFTSSCPKVLNYQKTTQELKSSVYVILLKWHGIKTLPYCITLKTAAQCQCCQHTQIQSPQKVGAWQGPHSWVQYMLLGKFSLQILMQAQYFNEFQSHCQRSLAAVLSAPWMSSSHVCSSPESFHLGDFTSFFLLYSTHFQGGLEVDMCILHVSSVQGNEPSEDTCLIVANQHVNTSSVFQLVTQSTSRYLSWCTLAVPLQIAA